MANVIIDAPPGGKPLSAVTLEQIAPLDFLGLLRALWHGKWTIAFTTILAVLLAGYYAFAVATPHYAATTTLQMAPTPGPMADIVPLPGAAGTDQTRINTEIAILQSDRLLGQLVIQHGLLHDPEFNRHLIPVPALSVSGLRTRIRDTLTGQPQPAPDPQAIFEKTVENLRDAITAGPQRDSYIFKITATTEAPAKSAQIANALAQLYLADQVAAKHGATEAAVTWLSDRVSQLQIDLEAKETAINALITRTPVQDGAALDALSRQAIDTGQRLAEARNALAEARNRATATARMSPATASDARHENTDITRLTSQIAALEMFQTSLNNQLAAQSEGQIRLQQLHREADATRVIYETFLTRLQDTQIRRGTQNPDSRVLSPANPGRYVAPRKLLILIIAALLGGVAGLVWVLVRRSLRTGFDDARALTDRMGLPVVGQIPLMPLRRRDQLLTYLRDKPASAAAEAIRNLRTRLLLDNPSAPPQVILCTSSVPGEGKTTQSICLAQDLSRLGRKVLLIDADARRSAYQDYFQKHAPGSLAQVVLGRVPFQEAILRDPRLDADILCSAQMARSPADLFFGAAFKAFMSELRATYDHIILDAPPVLPVPDARLLAPLSDAVLYTVAWRTTPEKLVEAGIMELRSLHVPITGLVLSRIDMRKARAAGGAYYADYNRAYHQN